MGKRASVVCHPESESQKKIMLDTEQDSTPRPSVSYGGSSASGARASATASADQNTSTSDVTRASSKDHFGCRDGEGQCRRKQCGTPKPVGIRQQEEDYDEE